MKKRKFIGMALGCVFALSCAMGVFTGTEKALAADDTISVTIQIEGVSENYYYDTVETDKTCLEDVLAFIDETDDSLTINMVDSSYGGKYISGINGDSEMQFGGYDGWMFLVNGEESPVGISSVTLNDGDNVVIYYSDAYGVGMQNPVADVTKIDEGILKVTSKDTIYDENWNATASVNPVTGATIKWYNGDEYTEYITDENGEILIPEEYLTNGEHKVSIEKYSDGAYRAPMVIRWAPDMKITIQKDVETGDSSLFGMSLVIAAASVLIAFMSYKITRKTPDSI